MPHRPVTLHASRGSVAAEVISAGIDELLGRHGDAVPQSFPAEVLAAAEEAAADPALGQRQDLTSIPFVTLDPATSTDLDQAMHLERDGEGYRVLYAIADVPAFVELDGEIDQEARRRGATVYLPDRRLPLHPAVLSEGAASLLPEQTAPAFVWDIRLDAEGEAREVALERALVRSREKLAYEQVQQQLDAGRAHPTMQLLQEIGALRAQRETDRGGASLNLPEQEVVEEDGRIRLSWRSPQPIEDANAQISLLTGMAAAQLMLEGGVGILRTLPPASEEAMRRFRRQADALGVRWPDELDYGGLLRSLDWRDPAHLALLNQAGSLFRGASYAAFTSPEEAPENPVQAAIAAPYSHATAPLRRLVDRFVLLLCHAHSRSRAVDPALLAAVPLVPEVMQSTAGRAGQLEREALDLVELAALESVVGETFRASIIERRGGGDGGEGGEGGGSAPRIEVQLTDPPVTAWIPADGEPGTVVTVVLRSVDRAAKQVRLELVEEAA